ncbi:hypothetical protein C1645_741453 [Glomus cerebriforme]|uniref:Uncharacterized protein n=1 Tax=Glomus cerebriforme TaxID=658196 RepID=A0A397SH92_9GLOM|nr:hypothetical protein C1645_741453 [Glomus cerebriforme]
MYYRVEEFEKFFQELADAEKDDYDDWSMVDQEEKLDAPIEQIAIGVIKKRVFGFRIPFIEHHALIVKTPHGLISLHYERNKNGPILNQHVNLNDWELTRFFTPRDDVTMANLYQDVEKFWIFPKFRFIQNILPGLFEPRIVKMLRREWARISLVQKTVFNVMQGIKKCRNKVDSFMTYIRKIFSRFLYVISFFFLFK